MAKQALGTISLAVVVGGLHLSWQVAMSFRIWPCRDHVDQAAETTGRVMHVVRHGQASHNVALAAGEIPTEESRLTELGQHQVSLVAKAAAKAKPEVVLTSPLTRCVETARLGFPGVTTVAMEELRELISGSEHNSQPCKLELVKSFPEVDFSSISDCDELWFPGRMRESQRSCGQRARRFLERIFEEPFRSMREFAVTSHSGFLFLLFNYGHAPMEGLGPRGSFRGSTGPVGDLGRPIVSYETSEDAKVLRRWWSPGELRSIVIQPESIEPSKQNV